MAVTTWLHFNTEDMQGRKNTLSFRIKPAAFGPATDLPTAAKIAAVGAALFGAATPSNSIVKSYSVEVREDAPAFAGGDGSSATSSAIRVRSELSTNNWLVSIPGADLAEIVFDPSNPNALSMTDTMWGDLRAALVDAVIAVSAPTGAYAAVAEENLLQVGTLYDGRRAPMRPR